MRSGIKLSQFLRNLQSTLAIFSYTAPCVQTMSLIYISNLKKISSIIRLFFKTEIFLL